MAATREALRPQRLTRRRGPRGVEGPPGSVHHMDLPRCMPLLAAPRHPRWTASAVRSDPCEIPTQQTDRTEQTKGLLGPTTRVRDPLITEAQRPLLRLLLWCLPPLISNPRDQRTTTNEPRLVYGPRPFNHHANLVVTIRDRLDSCQCRCTLIRRLTGVLSRRANSTMEQTLGHRARRDRREAPQTDGVLRHRLLSLI